MKIEQLFKIDEMILSITREKYKISRFDLKILSICRDSEETLYSLFAKRGLDRSLAFKRVKVMEERGFIVRELLGRKKIIRVTERSLEAIKFIESISIKEI